VPAPHLLIIDDEKSLRTAVRRWFTRRGWTCAEAGSVEEAERQLFTAGGHKPDAILCDMNLTDGTAEHLITRIANERADLAPRLVLATGDVLSAETERRLAGMGCTVLPKPFDLGQVEEALLRARALPAAS
jgi:DNA-binding NtrC family response regulator